MLGLLCWNVAGRVRQLAEQAELVGRRRPGSICLQEVTQATAQTWTQTLTEAGWPHVAVASLEPALAQGRCRPLGTLTAARQELTPVRVDGVPWPERVLSTQTGNLELINVHSPISPKPELVKVRTHEAVHAHLWCRTVRSSSATSAVSA
jgi:exonuclease III